jgi:hypothetical protein
VNNAAKEEGRKSSVESASQPLVLNPSPHNKPPNPIETFDD